MKTFLQFISEEQRTEGPKALSKPTTIKRDRDRLSRMEALLHELVNRRKHANHEN